MTLIRQTIALRESRDRLAAVMDNAGEGLVTIDEQGIIESFNNTAEKLFGYRAEEVIGQKMNVLMPSPYHEAQDELHSSDYCATRLEERSSAKGVKCSAGLRQGRLWNFPMALTRQRAAIRQAGALFTGTGPRHQRCKALGKGGARSRPAREQLRIGQDLHDSVSRN